MYLDRTVRRVRNLASDIDVDDVLDTLGLQRRSSALSYVLPAIGILGAGVLVGAGLGLLFAPSSGKALRREAETKVNGIKERIRHTNVIGQVQTNGVVDTARDFVADVVSPSFDSNAI